MKIALKSGLDWTPGLLYSKGNDFATAVILLNNKICMSLKPEWLKMNKLSVYIIASNTIV